MEIFVLQNLWLEIEREIVLIIRSPLTDRSVRHSVRQGDGQEARGALSELCTQDHRLSE